MSEERFEFSVKFLPFQGHIHRGLKKSELVAAVMTGPFEPAAIYSLFGQELAEGVGNLDFAPFARLLLFQNREDIGG